MVRSSALWVLSVRSSPLLALRLSGIASLSESMCTGILHGRRTMRATTPFLRPVACTTALRERVTKIMCVARDGATPRGYPRRLSSGSCQKSYASRSALGTMPWSTRAGMYTSTLPTSASE